MSIDISRYPLILLQNFSSKRKLFRKICLENSDLIFENSKTTHLLSFAMKDALITSEFTISDIKLDKGRILYYATKQPAGISDNGAGKLIMYDESLIDSFRDWIEIVNGFREFTFEDEIEQEYEAEFYDHWKFLDEDADIRPFKLNEQITILSFLNAANSIIESEEQTEAIEDIGNDIINIHETITKSSKNEVIRKISKIVAKGFKHSRKLGGELLGELKKYVFKEVITNGHHYVQALIDGLTNPPL